MRRDGKVDRILEIHKTWASICEDPNYVFTWYKTKNGKLRCGLSVKDFGYFLKDEPIMLHERPAHKPYLRGWYD